MRITIHGPNLTNKAEERGGVHAHASECGDNRHYGYGKKFGGEEPWNIEASTVKEVVEDVYGDHMTDLRDWLFR